MTNTLSCRTGPRRVFLYIVVVVVLALTATRPVHALEHEEMETIIMGSVDSSHDGDDARTVLDWGRSILQFSNQTASNSSSDLICCCPVGGGLYRAFDYEEPSPSVSCCCNTTDVCTECSQTDSFNSVCGSGQVCGILLLMATLIGTLAVTICVTGVFLTRRRRLRNATLDQFVSGSTAVGGLQQVQRSQIVNISEDQLKELYITQVPEGSHGGEIKECPICLDSVPVENGIWSTFPCGHGSCTICVNDLLRHSSRRVNSTTAAVLCPLCRTLAVAPMGEDNEPHIHVQNVVDDDDQGERDEDQGERDEEQPVDVVEDVEPQHVQNTPEPVEVVVVEDNPRQP